MLEKYIKNRLKEKDILLMTHIVAVSDTYRLVSIWAICYF